MDDGKAIHVTGLPSLNTTTNDLLDEEWSIALNIVEMPLLESIPHPANTHTFFMLSMGIGNASLPVVYVCMYVFMYVCMYVCMFVYMHMYVCI